MIFIARRKLWIFVKRIIADIGILKSLKAYMIKEGTIVVDVGIDREENDKFCGNGGF